MIARACAALAVGLPGSSGAFDCPTNFALLFVLAPVIKNFSSRLEIDDI